MELNTFTGISSGAFHTLTLQHAGTFQDLSTLISTLGGGGGTVTSATLPLSITNGVVSVDLSSYSTTAAINTLLASYMLISAMVNYSTTTQMTSAIATALTNYTNTPSLTNLLASKIDSVTVTAPLAISGTGTSRALTTLWKPSQVSLGTGLFGFADDPLGTLALSLTGTESRVALKLADTLGAIRNLTSDTSGVLTFDGVAQQPLLDGFTQTGSGSSLESNFASMLRIDAFAQPNNTQCSLVFKYDGSYGSSCFSNSSYWGWIPNSGQVLRFYNAQSLVALEVSALSNTTTIHGTFVNSSDRRLKTDIAPADYEKCQALFDAVDVKSYRRIDTETDQSRIGFIAQDIQTNAAPEWQNLVRPFLFEQEDETRVERLGLDYARLSCVLWGVLKVQQSRIDDLTSRISALENKGKKTKK